MTEITLKVGSPHVLRDHLRHATRLLAPGTDARHTLEDALTQVEAQLPGVEEPTERWSVIFANVPGLRMLEPKQLVKTDDGWLDANGNGWGDFASFSDVEVLRVGIGEPPPMTEEEIDESQATAQRNIQNWEPLGGFARTYTKTLDQDASYRLGREDFAASIRRQLTDLEAAVITAPEKRCYAIAIDAIAALLGES
jgi:hypothetical protein